MEYLFVSFDWGGVLTKLKWAWVLPLITVNLLVCNPHSGNVPSIWSVFFFKKLFLLFNEYFYLMGLFMVIIMSNWSSLLPFSFSVSAHWSFTMSMGMTSWLWIMILIFKNKPRYFMIHLVPYGTPLGLLSTIFIIELMGVIIRPYSLSIRLMANMMSGHIIISLCVGGSSILISLLVSPLLMGVELFVGLIQTVVFTMLLWMYYTEI